MPPNVLDRTQESAPWERFEFLAVFLVCLGIGFALPHLPVAVEQLRARWTDSESQWADTWLGVLDGQVPGYFRASVIAALVAVMLYAWVRLRCYSKRAMPSWWLAGILMLYIGCLVGVVLLKTV